MRHPGHGRRKVRKTDRYGRTVLVISCRRLGQTLDLREVCRVVKRCVRHRRRNFDTEGDGRIVLKEEAAHRIAGRRCSLGRAAVDPSRAGLCFAALHQQARFRWCGGGLNGLARHRHTSPCRMHLSHRHVIVLQEGRFSSDAFEEMDASQVTQVRLTCHARADSDYVVWQLLSIPLPGSALQAPLSTQGFAMWNQHACLARHNRH